MVFGVILFASNAASITFGSSAVYWTSALGGSVDVDAVALSLAEIQGGMGAFLHPFAFVLWIALAMNGLVKSGLALWGGGARFAWRVAASLGLVYLAGLAVALR